MKKSVLLGTGILATALLTGCGGSSSGGSTPHTLSTKDLTPVSGSDTIIGTWIGSAEFVETGTDSSYVETYQGTRMAVLQITDNGTGGYELTDCRGDTDAVTFNTETNAVLALDRQFVMTDFNRMTGDNSGLDSREWAYANSVTAEESWAWVKVSNNTGNIGSIDVSVSHSQGTTSEALSLAALCRESVAYSDSNGVTWTTMQDSGAFEYNTQASRFKFQIDSDGYKYAYIEMLGVNQEGDSIGLNITNPSAQSYSATYSSSGATSSVGAYTFGADLSLVISQ